MATAPMSGSRDSVTVAVTVPSTPSPRPDGKHFFYAIVYAGQQAFPARAWTGPLLTTPRAVKDNKPKDPKNKDLRD